MPKYKVTKHHTLVIEYTIIVEAPYASADTPEQVEENIRQRISAERVAEGTPIQKWTNTRTVEEDFTVLDIDEVTTEKWKADNDFAKSVCQMPD